MIAKPAPDSRPEPPPELTAEQQELLVEILAKQFLKDLATVGVIRRGKDGKWRLTDPSSR